MIMALSLDLITAFSAILILFPRMRSTHRIFTCTVKCFTVACPWKVVISVIFILVFVFSNGDPTCQKEEEAVIIFIKQKKAAFCHYIVW
jgi:hypothetical protein